LDRRSSASRAIHRGLFQMGGSAREERKAKVKPRYYYMPLLLGVFTPPGAVLWLEMYGPKHPLSPPFYFFDFFAVLALIPFLVLIGATKIISAVLTQPERTECIFWGGLLGATTLTAYGHATVWWPLYFGGHMSSTAVVAFLFIPFYAIGAMIVGMLIGGLISVAIGLWPGSSPRKGEHRRDDWRMD